jgi:PAS domain S-box-containing protein
MAAPARTPAVPGPSPAAGDLASFVRLMPSAVALTRRSDGRFLEVSDAYAAMFGKERDDLVGRTVIEAGILQPGERASMLKLWDDAAGPQEMTLPPRADGRSRTAIVQGVATMARGEPAYLVCVTDITERVRVESDLLETRALHEALLRAQSDAGEAIGIVDLETQRPVFLNDALRRLYGIPPGEMGRANMWDRLPPDERERIREDMRQRAARGEPGPLIRELTVVKDDGARLPVEVVMQRLTLHGRPHMLSIVRDLTQRKAAERALQDSTLSRAFVRRLLTGILGRARVSEDVVRTLGRELAIESAAPVLGASLDAFRGMGMGDLRLVQQEGNAYTFAGSDLLETQPGRGQSTCYLTLSFLEGAVSKARGAPSLGTEIRCRSRGHDECVFVVVAR